jgi:hypothetical protein
MGWRTLSLGVVVVVGSGSGLLRLADMEAILRDKQLSTTIAQAQGRHANVKRKVSGESVKTW